MTDGQVLGLLKTVNDAEIDAAKLDLGKSQSERVKKFDDATTETC